MKIITKIKKDKFLLGLFAVVSLVLIIRLWSFENLLIFKMDQARDIKLIEEAYNGGARELPLLGPRAAKTYLRLGPIFYYFEYGAMLVFGDKTWAVAIPDLIFSILTIFLFYYFLRQVFSKKISLLTTVVFSSSFFLMEYSRFAWNPNSIPFWSLLFFLGVYKLIINLPSTVSRSIQENNRQGKWLLVAAVGYGVASQLHFTAMLAYPLIALLFFGLAILFEFYLQERKIKLKYVFSFDFWKKFALGIPLVYWLGAFLIMAVFYLPVFLSERCTNWDNWVQFKYALSGRGKLEFPLSMKIIQSLKLHSEYFWFSLTSWAGGYSKIFVGLFLAISGALLFRFWQLFNWKIFRQDKDEWKKKVWQNKINRKKILLFLLSLVWFVVMFALYTKLAFNVLKPRYWLLELPIFFIWLALFFDWLKSLRGKNEKFSLVIAGLLVIMNLYAIFSWYWMLGAQKKNNLFGHKNWRIWDLKLKDENMISWGHLQKVADYLESLSKNNNKDVCFYTTGEYRPVYDYIFNHRNLSDKIRRISFGSDDNEKCLFVAVDHHQHRDIPRIPKNYKNEFKKVAGGKKEIGFVTVWIVERYNFSLKNSKKKQKQKKKEQKEDKKTITNNKKDKDISNIQDYKDEEQVKQKIQDDKKKIDSFKNTEKIDVENIEIAEKIKKPRRKERIRWKDIFNCHW